MAEIKLNIRVDVIGTQMNCVHCRKEVQNGDCEEGGSVIMADLMAMEDEGNLVMSDFVCPLCGSNTFEDVVAFINVITE